MPTKVPLRGVVLPRGPSDHCPFVKQLWFEDYGNFVVGDWNLHHDNKFAQAVDNFDRIIRGYGASVLLMQEVRYDKSIQRGVAKRYGWHYRSGGEFAITWDPDGWEFCWSDLRVMSTKPYWAAPNRMLIVVLRHRKTGRRVKFCSYHPPAHIQRPKHVTHKNVMAVYRDFCDERIEIARTTHMAIVMAGDGNVDPRQGWHPPGGWGFSFDRRPLVYVRPPEPTHHRRTIDEMFVKDLRVRPAA